MLPFALDITVLAIHVCMSVLLSVCPSLALHQAATLPRNDLAFRCGPRRPGCDLAVPKQAFLVAIKSSKFSGP
jgi:hypothetical protein